MLGSEQCHFPNLSFLTFAVTKDQVNTGILFLGFQTQCQAGSCGSTLAQRTGGHIDTGGQVLVTMARQMSAVRVQGLEHFHREISHECQRRVKRRACMTLGHDQAVTIFPIRVFRVKFHDFAVKSGKTICNRKSAANVAETTGFELFQLGDTNLESQFL